MYSSRIAASAVIVMALVVGACGDTTDATTTVDPGATTTTEAPGAPTTTEAPSSTTEAPPTTTEAPIPDPIKREMIEVTTPTAGDLVTSPLIVTGMSNTFEATVNYRLSAGGTVLAEGFTMGGTGDWAPFEATIEFENTCCTEMLLEVFEVSAQNGSEINLVSIPLAFPEEG